MHCQVICSDGKNLLTNLWSTRIGDAFRIIYLDHLLVYNVKINMVDLVQFFHFHPNVYNAKDQSKIEPMCLKDLFKIELQFYITIYKISKQ